MQETRVQSLGQEVPWRRKWQPTPVLLPRESQGWRSLVGYSPWGPKESDTQSSFISHRFCMIVLSLFVSRYFLIFLIEPFFFFLSSMLFSLHVIFFFSLFPLVDFLFTEMAGNMQHFFVRSENYQNKTQRYEVSKVKSPSRVRLSGTPWTVAYQAPLSMGFSRQ